MIQQLCLHTILPCRQAGNGNLESMKMPLVAINPSEEKKKILCSLI